MKSRAILFLIGLLFSGYTNLRSHLLESENFELIKLGDGLYSCIHKFGGKAICNVGIVDNGNETIIFDTFLSPEVATELLEIVKELELSPIKYVVNSHSHNDHIRGNQVFPQDIHIISTNRTMELIKEWEPLDIEEEKKYAPARLAHYDSLYDAFTGDKSSREYQQILMWKPYYEVLVESHHEIQTRLPDLFVDSVEHIHGPKRNVTLISKGAGHTESDLIMYLPDDGVIFTGDLVFNECHPYVPHGDISNWKKWLDFMNSLDAAVLMPGHGKIGNLELVDQMKNYLLDLETIAQQMIDEDQNIADLKTLSPPERYKEWWFDRFYMSNVRFAYESLKPNASN